MVCLGVAMLFAPRPAGSASANQLDVGLTFSPREAAFRNLPWQHAFDAALDASPSLVRLGAYWSEIESEPGRYDFTTVDWLLDRATARQQRVLLTVGMKAPRWPEYYLPGWLTSGLELPEGAQLSDHAAIRTATLAFVRATVEHVRPRSVVAAWQVENEPLDPSGPHAWRVGNDFLSAYPFGRLRSDLQKLGVPRSVLDSRGALGRAYGEVTREMLSALREAGQELVDGGATANQALERLTAQQQLWSSVGAAQASMVAARLGRGAKT